MQRFVKMLIIVVIILALSSCVRVKTYDELLAEYQTYIENNQAVYRETIDYFNHISTESIKSVVLVKKTQTSNQGTTTGSGVIFKEDTNYYYALTNNHVVYILPGTSATYQVSDYRGNDYSATKVVSSADYDLAVVRFRKGTTDLDVMTMAPENPVMDDRLSVMGYPSFQINAITMGNVISYSIINIDAEDENIIDVDFEVLVTDAPVKSGSSGSVVINDHYEIIGIIYAGNFTNDDDTATFSFAIPIDKVVEFLTNAGIDIGGDA